MLGHGMGEGGVLNSSGGRAVARSVTLVTVVSPSHVRARGLPPNPRMYGCGGYPMWGGPRLCTCRRESPEDFVRGLRLDFLPRDRGVGSWGSGHLSSVRSVVSCRGLW